MPKSVLPLAACLLAVAAAGAHAQALWKWRDASGQLHVSDTAPPAGTPARNIISGPPGMVAAAPTLTAVTPGSAASAAAEVQERAPAASSAAESALEKRKKAADQERADKAKADREALEARNAAIRKDNCARAQGSLAGLQSGARVALVNTKGEREFLDDAGRAREIKHAQDVIAQSCGPAPAPATAQ